MNIEYRHPTENDAYDIERLVAYSWHETYTGIMDENYLLNRIQKLEMLN